MTEKFGSNTLIKLGIVCEDVEDTARRYLDLFQTVEKPAHANETPPMETTVETYKEYMGQRCEGAPMKVVNIYIQPIWLELVQPLDGTPSPWRRHLDRYGTSVCFAAFFVDGFERQIDLMAGKGYPLLFREEKGFERYAYFDTMEKLGFLIEAKERKIREAAHQTEEKVRTDGDQTV